MSHLRTGLILGAVLLTVLVCGGAVGTVGASDGGPVQQSVELTDNGTVSGQVTDADTGVPVPNASVVVANLENISVTVATTDSNGDYSLSLEPGLYAVGALVEGYEPALEQNVTVLANETTTVDFALTSLQGDPAVTLVDDPAAGTQTNHLWGTVVTSAEPRTLAEIELNYSGTGADLSDIGGVFPATNLQVIINGGNPEPISLDSTAESVTVGFDTLISDPPTVEPGDIIGIATLDEPVVNPPTSGTYEPTLSLRNGTGAFAAGPAPFDIVNETGTIAGTVSDNRSGDPVEGAAVAAVSETGDRIGGDLTGGDGSYGVTVPPDNYTLSVLSPEYQPAVLTNVSVEGNDTTVLDVSLDPATETFVVAGLDTSAPTGAGDTLVVEPTVVNAGTVNGTQTVELLVNGTQVESATPTLEPGGTWNGTFTYETSDSDRPALNVSVSTANDSATTTAQVHEAVPDPAVGDVDGSGEVSIVDVVRIQRHLAGLDPGQFEEALADINRDGEISIADVVLLQQRLAGLRAAGNATVTGLDASAAVPVGGLLNVSAAVTNTGGMGVLQAVEFRIANSTDGLTPNATEAVRVVDLHSNETAEMSLNTSVASLLPGEYSLGVFTEDTERTTTFNVTLPGPNGAPVAPSNAVRSRPPGLLVRM